MYIFNEKHIIFIITNTGTEMCTSSVLRLQYQTHIDRYCRLIEVLKLGIRYKVNPLTLSYLALVTAALQHAGRHMAAVRLLKGNNMYSHGRNLQLHAIAVLATRPNERREITNIT